MYLCSSGQGVRRGRGAPSGGGGGGSSALATAAAGLAAGQWTTFTANYPSTLAALIDAGGSKRITEYADKGIWDASRKQAYFTGGGHGQDEKTIVYHDSTNTWEDLGTPPWYTPVPGNATHGYQHNSFNSSTQYYGIFSSRTIRTRDVVANTWSTIDTSGINQYSGLIGSTEWFPSYGAGGSLVITQGLGPLDNDPGTVVRWFGGSWTEIANPPMGSYHNFGVYSPPLDLMFLGGGNGSAKIHTLSNTGTVTARTDCPADLGIISSINTIDPVSGKLLVLTKDKVCRVFDNGANTWSTDTAPPAGFWSGNIYVPEVEVMGTVAFPIYDYGVTMFITIAGPDIYLRKGR